jgi:hypothetical protein
MMECQIDIPVSRIQFPPLGCDWRRLIDAGALRSMSGGGGSGGPGGGMQKLVVTTRAPGSCPMQPVVPAPQVAAVPEFTAGAKGSIDRG